MQCRVLPAALVGVVALISATSVQAASFNDTYAGGANYYNPNANNGDVKGDVIGDVSLFNTTSMDVSRIGADLQVVIHTNYAANPNALGTGFGALFLSTSTINLPGSSPYSTDTFVGNEGRFQYAFTMPFAPNFNGNIATGNSSLYALAGDGSDVQLSHGQGGNNDTSGTNFRNDQAVDYKYKDQAGLSGHDDSTWTVDQLNKTITFLIKNENGMFGTDFALAWAMTCANDIILGNVSVELCPTCGPPPGETPLPAALSLFASGLGVLGLAGYRRRKRASAQA